MMHRELPPSVIGRRAVIYVRQSTALQVQENLESQRRQYELADLAKEYGFQEVVVIDVGPWSVCKRLRSIRPGFRNLVGQICEGVIGAVFCLEASRLSRNGRDWHHLIELCGLVGAPRNRYRWNLRSKHTERPTAPGTQGHDERVRADCPSEAVDRCRGRKGSSRRAAHARSSRLRLASRNRA